MHGNQAVDAAEIQKPARAFHERVGNHRHHQSYDDGEEKLAGNVHEDIAEALRLGFRFVCSVHAVSPLPPRLYYLLLGFWLERHTLPPVALAYLDTGQHATFEIQCSAQIRKIFVPAGVEVTALPATDLGLIGALLRHCLCHQSGSFRHQCPAQPVRDADWLLVEPYSV